MFLLLTTQVPKRNNESSSEGSRAHLSYWRLKHPRYCQVRSRASWAWCGRRRCDRQM